MKTMRMLLILILLSFGGLACNLLEAPPEPTALPALPSALPSPRPTFTPVFPTITPLPPATAVILPTAIPTPAPTATPAPTSTPAPTRIRFATGTTGTTLANQSIPAVATQSFALDALAGQVMTVQADLLTPSSFDSLSVLVYGADGTLLGRDAPNTNTWTGTLPATQDYRIDVQNLGGPSVYNLQVSIPRVLRFASGETTTALSGSVTAPAANTYTLQASAGQVLTVDVIAPGGNAYLTVRGVDGAVLLSADERAISWTGTLPTTQAYLVSVASGFDTAEYTLRVAIPERIRFARGATATTITGSTTGRTNNSYVLEAGADQVMQVSVSAPDTGNNVWLAITGADGTIFLRQEQLRAAWTGKLPATQDYTITVISDGEPAAYSLQVTIPRRIRFTPGSSAITLDGVIAVPAGMDYVLEARAGQLLTVTLTPSTDLYFSVVGVDGSPLVRYAPTWQGTLPLSQDYFIHVAAAGGATGLEYILDVSVTG